MAATECPSWVRTIPRNTTLNVTSRCRTSLYSVPLRPPPTSTINGLSSEDSPCAMSSEDSRAVGPFGVPYRTTPLSQEASNKQSQAVSLRLSPSHGLTHARNHSSHAPRTHLPRTARPRRQHREHSAHIVLATWTVAYQRPGTAPPGPPHTQQRQPYPPLEPSKPRKPHRPLQTARA